MGGTVNDTNPGERAVRVLVVEGNAKEATAVRNSLKASPPNFVVSPARQLWSATQILAGMSIDAVLLDLNLPDSEGISALTELRDQSPHTPMLIMGGDDVLGHQAVEAGADAYLSREELDPNTLGVRILEAIERRRVLLPEPQESETTAPDRPTARILVVEEDPWVQRLLRRNLNKQGHQVEVVNSPQDALAWAESSDEPLDLLICDVHPPGMDGERLSSHLTKKFGHMVTLLVSPNAQRPEIVSKQPDAFAFLSKPYSLDDFQAQVEKLITNAASPVA